MKVATTIYIIAEAKSIREASEMVEKFCLNANTTFAKCALTCFSPSNIYTHIVPAKELIKNKFKPSKSIFRKTNKILGEIENKIKKKNLN